MKPILNTLMLATMAVAGFAADKKLNFHAEFPFTVGKVAMPAGQYSVAIATRTATVIQITNAGDGKSAFVNLPSKTALGAADRKAEIVFRCGDRGCSITKVANLLEGHANSAWTSKDKASKLIAISLTPNVNKAD